ncbi:MAG: Dabb family protein [Gemmataceae bacterium]|nr:Dabb family protein [Gemmataceae bacterium]
MIRRIVGLMVVALAALIVAQGASAGGEKQGKKKAPYVHTVYFYLKKDAPKEEVSALIEDSHKLLAKIPSVRGLWVGRPAEQSTPKFAAKDYAVGLLVLFDDYAGLEQYLKHPLHDEYLEKHGKHWEKVSVYDFMNQKK